AEDEVGRAVGTQRGERHSVENRGHGMFSDTEVKVAAAVFVGFEIPSSLEGKAGLSRWSEVGRAADEPGIMRRDGVQNFARGGATRETFRVGRKTRQCGVPAFGKLALLHALELIGEVRILGSVRLKLGEPHLPKLPAPLTNAGPEM